MSREEPSFIRKGTILDNKCRMAAVSKWNEYGHCWSLLWVDTRLEHGIDSLERLVKKPGHSGERWSFEIVQAF